MLDGNGELLRCAGGRNDTRAHGLTNLDRGEAHTTGCTEDEQSFACLHRPCQRIATWLEM